MALTKMKISGNIVAVVTPMQADGAIDENCLGDFLDELIEQGANGVVIAGTTRRIANAVNARAPTTHCFRH